MESKELKNIAPELYKLKQLETGFEVPKGYFESLEDGVLLKISTSNFDKELPFKTPKNYFETIEDKVITTVKSNEQENNFSIPENYFETIEDRVFEKINQEPKVINIKTKFVRTFLPIAAAASLLLFLTLKLSDNKSPQDHLANLESSEIENWINNGDLELNSFEIASVYEDENFDDLELNQLNDDKLVEYLNDIDIESLILTN